MVDSEFCSPLWVKSLPGESHGGTDISLRSLTPTHTQTHADIHTETETHTLLDTNT